MNILLVAEQMLILFAMMFTGYLIFRLHWVTEEAAARLSSLVVNVFNPFLTISSVFGKSISSTGFTFWENLILVGLFYLILFLTGLFLIVILRPDSTQAPIFRLLTLLPNCGFMGIPVVSALLGTDYVIYVAIYMLAYNIILYTYGIFLVDRSNPQPQMTKKEKQRTRYKKLRLILCSFLTSLLPFDDNILRLFLIMLSMPAGSMVVLVTEEYGGQTECAASGVVLSTLASIVTIPIVSLFY